MQKKACGGSTRRSLRIAVAVQGVVPQGMPKSRSVCAYLVTRPPPDAAASKGQPHPVKLRIFGQCGQVELRAVKVVQGQKLRPARPARVAVKHSGFAAFVSAQGKPDGIYSSSLPASRAT